MTQDDPHELARLLGVGADTDAEHLRAAYEQAMNRATRAGDHARALQLSRAFDALPDRKRKSVYSGGRTYATVLTPEPHRPRTPRRTRSGASGSRRRNVSWKGVSWKGIVVYGVVVPAIVVLVGWAIYRQNNPSYDDYPPTTDDRAPSVVVQH